MLNIGRYADCVRKVQKDRVVTNRKHHLKVLKVAKAVLSQSILNDLRLSWFMNARQYNIVVPFSDAFDLEFRTSEYSYSDPQNPSAGVKTEDRLCILLVNRLNKNATNFSLDLNSRSSRYDNSIEFKKWVFNHAGYSLIHTHEFV
jgi:hypothetical protein